MGKNFAVYLSDKGLTSRNLQRAETDLQEKNKQAHSKVGKGHIRHFTKEDIYEANDI